MANINEYTVKEAQNIQLGQAGAKYINNGAEHTGTFVAIHCLSNCTFSKMTPEDSTNGMGVNGNGNSMTDQIPAGTIFYGKWSALQAGNGHKYIAYLG
tara:strand:+ start:3656 stop:3949 length:294 start_codon:yes stop_codon:yes gene_type:complete